MQRYQVGGAVRDALLGHPRKDRDWVVVGATPEELRALGFRQVGRDFPVFLHPETGEEHALARRERSPGQGGFDPGTSLWDDLRCRDLTINAMAMDEGGRLIDPFGGQIDLQRGVLRHVSPAFTEDPLRVLRVARFAARYAFTVAAETLALMARMGIEGTLDILVPERVWRELAGALGEAQPWRFIEVLRACGALVRILPEVDRLFGVPQPANHHPEVDTGLHTLLALRQAARLSRDPKVRFAVLVHDLGKGMTPAARWPHHPDHEQVGAGLVGQICQRLRAPRSFRELAALTARYHTHCHRAHILRPGTLLKLLERLDALRRPERFELFVQACEADARGRYGREEAPYPQAELLRSALQAARTVEAAPLVAQGFSGAALAHKLHRLRLERLRRNSLSHETHYSI
jgi:tRNA nucleotidyltransferase (CCA-adding enzyme)